MALTRPRLGQLITNVASLTDNLTVINSAATQANVDVGFIFNRTDGVGLVPNVALYWNETTKSFSYVYTVDTGDLTSANIVSAGYANVASGNLTVTGVVNITNTGDVSANIGTLYSANISTQANIGTLYLGNIATQANLGAYQTFANANAASQAGSLNTINANLGGFQLYANTAINSIVTNANANTAAYLTTATGNLSAGNISTAGNISGVSYVFANNFVYTSNGINILSSVNANIGVLYLGNVATQANLGAYQNYANSVQIWANANVSSLQNQVTGANNSIQAANANIGSYQTWANANVSSLQNQVTGANNSIQAANANIGSYQTWANANVSSLQNQVTGANNVIQVSNANVGAYQTFANTANATTQANLGAYQIYANANAATQALSITSLATNANANTAAYLLTATGNISAGNITTTGNIYSSYIITTGATSGNISNVYAITANVFQFANGVNILSTATGTYSNANVTAYLTTASFTAPTADVSLKDQVTATSTNAVFYPPFFNATSGNLQNFTNATLAFNPATGALYSYSGTFNSVYAAAFGNLNSIFTGASINTTNGYIGTIDSATLRATTIGNTGATLTGTLSTASQNNVTSMTGLVTIGATGITTTVTGNLYVGGNLTVAGNSVSIASASLSIQDPIINLHTPNGMIPLTFNDGADIGVKLHYYDGADRAAFFGRANDTGYLEWYGAGTDAGNTFIGTAYGTIKTGSLILANARTVGGGLTANTGTLQVLGDGSINGNLYIGAGLIASGVDMVVNAASQATSINSINANLGAYQTYANTQISTTQANLGAYQTFANANVSSLQNQIFASNANTGAYQTFANANISSLQNQITGANTNIQTTSANLGAYQIFANTQISTTQANLGAFQIWSNINSLTTQANLGAYQIFANANVSSLQNQIFASNANLGAYQIYANTTNTATQANLGAYQTFANANAASQQTQITSIVTTANANTAAYLLTATGNISAGNIITSGATSGNITGANVIFANTFVFANGVNILTSVSSPYNNANVAAYIPTDPTFTGYLTFANANAATQATSINSINANLGAYQTFANANVSSLQTQITNVTTNANTNTAAYLTTATGNISAGNITVFGNLTVANIIFTNQEIVSTTETVAGNSTVTGNLVAAATTTSTNTTTGALVVSGGVGVAGSLYVGSLGSFAGGVITSQLSSSNSSPRLYNDTQSNISIGGASSTTNILSTTLSTSTTTGALVVRGGVGIAGALYIANTGDVSANIGAYQTFANANVSSLQNQIFASNANIGSYQLFANANVSSLQNQIFASNANIGSYQIYANANAASQATAIGSLATNANANTAAYLTTATGNISAGNITVTGSITATANIVARGFLGVGNTAPINVNSLMINQNSDTTLISSAAIHVQGKTDTTPLLIMDAFGTNQSSYIIGRKANGTAAVPTAAGVGDCMAGLVGIGYGATGWQTGTVRTLPGFSIHGSEAYTDTAYGSQAEIRTTPIGSNIALVRLQVSANGAVSISSTANSNGPLSGALQVAGGAGFSGNVVTTGNIFAGGNLIIAPTAAGLIGRTSNSTALLVNPSGVRPVASTSFNPLVHFVGRDGQTATVAIDCFGDGCGYISRHGRGTLASPTAAGANDCLGGVMGIGYGTTGFSTANIDSMPGLKITSTDLFTDISMPTKLDLRTVPVGSNTAVIAMSLSANGVVSITNTTDSTSTTTGALVVAGGIAAAGNITANAFYSSGAGSLYLSSNTNVNLTAINAVAVTQSVFRLAGFTTAAASSLTPQNGDLIYNNTIGNIQIYNGTGFGNVVVSDVNGNIRATQFTFANGVNILSTVPSSYGNANVAAYLPTDTTFTGYLTFANANAATQATSIDSINANIGAYQTFANTTNAATQANLGSYQIYANTAIQTLSANIGTLVVGAPGALDTLYEISQSLGNNTSLSSTLINSIAGVQANVTAANLRIAGLNSTGNVTFTSNLQYNSNGVTIATATPGPYVVTDPGVNGARFSVTNNYDGTYSVALVDGGVNYNNSNTITIPGASLGGATTTNNLTITVTGQSFGTITSFTFSGTAATAYAWRFTDTGNVIIPTGANLNYANGHSILGSINARNLATNAAIVTANTSVVSYVNTVANSLATGANVNAAAYFGTFGGNLRAGFINLTGNIYAGYSNVTLLTGAQPNVTSLGTLSSLAVSGNITANGISSVGNVTARSIFSSGNITSNGELLVNGKMRDINGNAGLSGQFLVSTSTGIQWYTQAGAGSSTLAGLGDVNLSSPQAQQVLTYNGTYWVNAAAGVTVASAVFASSQSDMGSVTDGILTVTEDEGLVTEVANNIYDLGVLSFTGIISLNNIDQSIKSDYLSYSIIFGF
jgi:filamentous hemagglutinin